MRCKAVGCVNAALPRRFAVRLDCRQRAGGPTGGSRTWRAREWTRSVAALSCRNRADARGRRAAVVAPPAASTWRRPRRKARWSGIARCRSRPRRRSPTCSSRRPASRSSCSAPAAPTSCAASSRRATAARCSSTCSRIPSRPPPARMTKKGMFVPFKATDFDKVPAEVKDPDGMHVAQRLNVMAIYVRDDMLPAADRPKTWTDLAEPEIQGQDGDGGSVVLVAAGGHRRHAGARRTAGNISRSCARTTS